MIRSDEARMTVVTWNVDGWHTIRDAQLDLLDNSEADVLLLQEVTPLSLERLRDRGWHGHGALELLPDEHTERDGVRPRFSCAVLARPDVELVDPRTVPDAPSPVRTLVARSRLDGRRVCLVSAALPPGSMWGRPAKVGQAQAIGTFLAGTPYATVLGMDRNGPKHEHWDPAETVWWREDDPSFFAPGAEHGLRDVLVGHLEAAPDVAAEARRARPAGPLAISYIETRTNPPTSRRYDVIMASEHWTVDDVAYDYPGAVEAGSDHAIVTACLHLTA